MTIPKGPTTITTSTKSGSRSVSSIASSPRWSYAWHICLLSIIALQWLLLTVLLYSRDHQGAQVEASLHDNSASLTSKESFLSSGQLKSSRDYKIALQNQPKAVLDLSNSTATVLSTGDTSMMATGTETRKFPGVAATIIFRAPRWFYLRYTLMIHNALQNIPADWALQIFINEKWVEKEGLLDWHPGLVRLMNSENNPRIIVTPLPEYLLQGKPKQIMVHPWFWNKMVADKVLLFSGNGAFCGNHPESVWSMLSTTDYCAAPWSRHDGNGGNAGTHSYRNRTAMLEVLQHHQENNKGSGGDVDVVKEMLDMNLKGLSSFRVASVDQTMQFGGASNLSVGDALTSVPLAISGTKANMMYKQRDSLLKHCPELKMIFPSLHEPSCFGAHPVKDTCQATICAMQEPLPRGGC
jgi:hypothetical protein